MVPKNGEVLDIFSLNLKVKKTNKNVEKLNIICKDSVTII